MDKKIFEVEISNGGPESYKTSTVLTMPCTQAEFRDALQKARIRDIRTCSNELTKIGYPGITSDMIGQNVDLLELNLLATRLATLSEDDQMGMDGLLQIEMKKYGTPIAVSRLINLTFNADICTLAPRVSNTQELGALLYEGEMLSNEAMTLLDTTEVGSDYQKSLLAVFGQKHLEDHRGIFTNQGYVEPGNNFKELYRKGEMLCFMHDESAVVLEVRKGFFNDLRYDSDEAIILNLPAADDDIWRAVEEVDAVSMEECVLRCIDCEIPSLRDAIDDAIDQEGGIGMANEFAKSLAQKEQIWHEEDWIKYKALLSVTGHPSLQDAIQLMHGLEQYELLPEVTGSSEYVEFNLRKKCPDLPKELFQTAQAFQIGWQMLEDDNAIITAYGVLRRKDGGHLPFFHSGQEKQHELGGMEMM